ncbi:unnamed protein product [Nippostrongylus brasiliensis]|uniref:Dolichyl-diphosphooligosaccharide--protein glycosyltransferase subunit 1 n=1 Tax=Nippostrongylus brasiliensis TaxID=27835 RepID=A0A0N4XS65_NIPBR|nr:unnamed protein product [Nippostrongylus brasiliensis]
MIREPMLATAFFLALFTAVVIYMRFDFTIVADPHREARERIQGKAASLGQLIEKKNRVFSHFLNAVTQYKTSRDAAVLQDGKKKLEADRTEINGKLTNALASLKEEGQDVYEKVFPAMPIRILVYPPIFVLRRLILGTFTLCCDRSRAGTGKLVIFPQ